MSATQFIHMPTSVDQLDSRFVNDTCRRKYGYFRKKISTLSIAIFLQIF